jgi:hypothetical protein
VAAGYSHARARRRKLAYVALVSALLTVETLFSASAAFGRVPGGNDPGSITDVTVSAKSFVMPRGYTMVWSGWDKSAGTSTANFNATITLPVATNPDGSPIRGPASEYIVTSGTATSFTLSYPAFTVDRSQATSQTTSTSSRTCLRPRSSTKLTSRPLP